MFTLALPILASLALVRAQMVHDIQVGGVGMLTFTPNNISAAPGDILNFVFHQTNHTATQSSFAEPCVELKGADGMTPVGFDSGFMPVAADMSANFPAYQITVNDTTPIWVYCRQTGHCGKGMVFSANAPATGNTFEAFQELAIQQNGTATASTTSAASSTATSMPPPSLTTTVVPVEVSIVTVTATVTVSGNAVATTYGSYPGSPAPTVAAAPQDHRVIVGGTGGLVYSPDTVTALIGDTVTFEFHSLNHTASQSSFNDPCRKLALTSTTGQVGFDSNFMPVSANATTFPTFTVPVNSTSPVWVYCRQTGHCGKGMVMAINPPTTGNTFAAFQQLAIQINGTAAANASASASATTSAAPSATTSAKSGAAPRHIAGAGAALALLAVVASLVV